MNAYLLCTALLACYSVSESDPVQERVDDVFGEQPGFVQVVRAQSPAPVYGDPTGYQPVYQPPQYAPPPQAGTPSLFGNVFQSGPGPQPVGDPFLATGPGAPQAYSVTGSEFPFAFYDFGPPQPGARFETSLGILPSQGIKLGGGGDFGVIEFDLDAGYTAPTGLGWILTVTNQFRTRWWEGPPGINRPSFGLDGNVYSFGWDFELQSPYDTGPWGVVAGFNPSLNTDFERGIHREAIHWDGRVYLTYQANPTLKFIGGFGYWDRVNDRFIPYAGAIYKPNDRWEFHLTAPEARVVYFLGNGVGGSSRWLYARAEYHVEAYQVETGTTTRRVDNLEIQDYRILIGYTVNRGFVNFFVEGGWVIGRETDFLKDTQPDFDIASGFIGRAGLRF